MKFILFILFIGFVAHYATKYFKEPEVEEPEVEESEVEEVEECPDLRDGKYKATWAKSTCNKHGYYWSSIEGKCLDQSKKC